MAKYRVSYKVLGQQGEEMKAIAKQVGAYSERLEKICANLGGDEMLAEVRTRLTKLASYFGEARASLNTAGELLSKSVQSYTSTESRNVKRVDGVKAHSRDFYKNPVVVASAGGAAAPVSNTTVNYTETNTINYNVAPTPSVDYAATAAPAAVGFEAVSTPLAGAAGAAASGGGTGVAAGIGAVAGAVAGAVGTGVIMNAKGQAKDGAKGDGEPSVDDSPEAQLERALAEARRLATES